MLKENQIVDIKVRKNNIEHLKRLGYKCELGEIIKIDAKHLTSGMRREIILVCDYCGKEYITCNKAWQNNKRKQLLKKDACSTECRNEYTKEVTIMKYGVENVGQSEIIKNKIKNTNLEKYGVEHYSQTGEYKDKCRNTCLERYGVDSYSKTSEYKERISATMLDRYGKEWYTKTDEYKKRSKQTFLDKYGVTSPQKSELIQEKTKQTNLQRYGVENVFANEEVKQKIKNTWNEKYGVEYYSQTDEYKLKMKERTSREGFWEDRNEKSRQSNLDRYGVTSYTKTDEYKDKVKATNLKRYGVEWSLQSPVVREKIYNTFQKNGSIPTSKQQLYLFNLLGGELNYFTGKCFLDIAFKDDMIYLEYDGGGHDLDVKLGTMTEEEFKRKEIKRYFALKNEGWKFIRIISKNDKIPNDEDILSIHKKCLELLKEGNNWVEVDYNAQTIKTFSETINYKCEKLRRVC